MAKTKAEPTYHQALSHPGTNPVGAIRKATAAYRATGTYSGHFLIASGSREPSINHRDNSRHSRAINRHNETNGRKTHEAIRRPHALPMAEKSNKSRKPWGRSPEMVTTIWLKQSGDVDGTGRGRDVRVGVGWIVGQ